MTQDMSPFAKPLLPTPEVGDISLFKNMIDRYRDGDFLIQEIESSEYSEQERAIVSGQNASALHKRLIRASGEKRTVRAKYFPYT